MADENLRSRHAFGALENVDDAISSGKVDAYDILFLKDENGKPYVGWVDKEGNKVVVQEDDEVVVVSGESLPETGEVGKIYVFGEEGYVYNGTNFVNLCKPTDVSSLESQITELESEFEGKVDAETVRAMIEEHSESMIEVIEF